MIEGRVNSAGEAVVVVEVRGPGGQARFEAAVDTGFDGHLALPLELVSRLRLSFVDQTDVTLADGSVVTLKRHEALIWWRDRPRVVPALAIENGPLVGMGLLARQRLTIDVVDGGPVTILPLD